MKVAPEMTEPQPQARRLRTDELRTIAGGGGVLVVGVDTAAATGARAETTIGVVEFPASPAGAASFADVIADAVLAKLTAAGVVAPPPVITIPSITSDASARRPAYVDLTEAAQRLGTTKQALKKYLARHQRREGRDTVCSLGAGARAVKIRGRWRVRFDDEGRP